MKVVYSIVIPAYNEEEVITASYNELKKVMDSTMEGYELIFVNDGSKDKTLEILSEISVSDPNVKVIDFSRNFGHQIAITAGMDNALGDAVVFIDADLQDPPEVILEMIAKWKDGYEVVYGKRKKREGETFFKKFTASTYYRILKSITKVDMPVDTGDFRLIDRKVCEAMQRIKEKNRYMRGLVSWVGYKQTAVLYDRHERFAGETKYPLKKMIQLALDGIISFSSAPLKLATFMGTLALSGSFIYLIAIIILDILKGSPGFIHYGLFFVIFFQGVILISLGFFGEYIGRIYDEAKDRPLYLISQIIQNKDENTDGKNI